MPGRGRTGWRVWGLLAAAALAGCSTAGGARRGGAARAEVAFEPVHITGDAQLEGLNDEELLAKATAAFAAEDWRLAARAFGRLVDLHPDSPHARAAAYQAGLAHQRLREWEAAHARFAPLADAARGTDASLEAAFRVAETLYHLERYPEAVALLTTIAERRDLPAGRRIEAQVQRGVCELEAGQPETAEASLRGAIAAYEALEDRDEVDDYFPAQAHFFRGEIFRMRSEAVPLEPQAGVERLSEDLNTKAELLLSAQGHYLRAIRVGNGYWATASGAQVGQMYEQLYAQMVSAPPPPGLEGEEAQVYRQEVRRKVRVLLTKSIGIYERTLEAAERIGSRSVFVERSRERLRKLKELLLADAEAEGEGEPATPSDEADGEPHS